MLVRMLRTEIGEVYNRAAWGDPALLTLDIRELYKEPLQIQGWDAAIIEVLHPPADCQCVTFTSSAQQIAVAHVCAPCCTASCRSLERERWAGKGYASTSTWSRTCQL